MSNENSPHRYLSGSQGQDPRRRRDEDRRQEPDGAPAAQPPSREASRPAWLDKRYNELAEEHEDVQYAHDEPDEVYDEPEQGYEDDRDAYDDPGRGYDDPRQGHADPRQGHADPRPRYDDPRHGYAEPRPTYADRRQDTDDRRQGPADRRYAEPQPGFGGRSGSVDSRQAFDQARRAHAERHGVEQAPRAAVAGAGRVRHEAAAGPTVRRAAPAPEIHDDDPERLYETFNDLYEDFEEGRSKTPFVIIGALLAVAIVGGGLAFAYKTSGGDAGGIDGPPVIRADETAAKVAPDDPGGLAIPHQDRQIYEQVAGQGEDQLQPPSGEQSPSGQQLGLQGDGQENLTIGGLAERVTDAGLPANTGAGEAGTAGQPKPLLPATGQGLSQGQTQPQNPNASLFEPRRVRTVNIGPDGKIISGPEPASAPTAPPAGATTLAANAPAAQSQPAPSALLPSGNAARLPTQTPAAPPPTLANGIATTPEDDANALPGAPDLQTAALVPAPRPKPRPTRSTGQTTLQPSAAPQPRPIQRTAAAPANDAPLQGYAVQVASHRSQADAVAKFADLQNRYPTLISGFRPLIQRADLGNRGVFYRLRIGPVASRSEATRLCTQLQDAGLAGCFVRGL